MSIIIGRAGSDATNGVLRFNKVRWDGDDVDLSGWVRDASSTAEMRAVRDQIRGLSGDVDFPVVPVTFSEDPSLDGFYRVTSSVVDSTPTLMSGVKALPFDVGLRRVRSAGSPVHESRLLHALRSGSAVTSASSDPLVGVPPDTTVYRRGTVGLGSLSSRNCANQAGSASAGSVLVDVWAGSDSQADAEWQCPPATFLEGQCSIGQSTGGGAHRSIVGRQVPADISANTEWVFGNGLVAVFPSEAFGGTAGTIRVLSWAGTAYESSTELKFFTTVGAPLTATFTGVTILRNSPEACTIRLNLYASSSNEVFTVDLTVRRGDRNVIGHIQALAQSGNVLGIGETSAAIAVTSLTGGIRRTSNDADGNRFVLTTAKSGFSSSTAGIYKATSDYSTFDFGFGVEIGGSGSTGIDTAQSLANQYAGYVAEQVSTVNP